MACASKTNLVSPKKFSHEHLKCNNKEYTVLEGSAGRKIISNKNEAKQVKNRKQLTLKPTRDGKLWKSITCTQNAPLSSSQKTSRYATRREIYSADGSTVAYTSLGSKLQKGFLCIWSYCVNRCFVGLRVTSESSALKLPFPPALIKWLGYRRRLPKGAVEIWVGKQAQTKWRKFFALGTMKRTKWSTLYGLQTPTVKTCPGLLHEIRLVRRLWWNIHHHLYERRKPSASLSVSSAWWEFLTHVCIFKPKMFNRNVLL